MKSTLVLCLAFLSASVFLPACDKVEDVKDTGKSISEAVGGMDSAAVKTALGDLTSKLGDIKDLASAEEITKKVGPLLDIITKGKDMLSGAGDMAGITEAIASLKTRFAGKEDIMKVLQPLIERLSTLVK